MPYIPVDRKRHLVDYDSLGMSIKTREILSAGELNYAITCLVIEYIAGKGKLSYGAINEAIGALECSKLELYRRLAVPYEDKKIKENGDVY